MAEAIAKVGEIDICFETFGDASDPAMLLIMGLGTQMLAWHEDFCEQLAARGYFVIRHDNRDIGRSTHLDELPVPSFKQLALRSKTAGAYTLSDMARDSVGVLDHLGIDKAHIVGASMGGMIAQRVAIEHPERTLSLVSIMSNSGDFWHGQPALTMYAVLLRPAPKDREKYIEHGVNLFSKLGGSGWEPDIEDLRDIASRGYDRGHNPRGSSRQLGAIVADPDRAPELRKLKVPATVIHGAEDRLVRPSGGRATAKAIPGATLVQINGMGHGLPRGAWPQIIGAITQTAERATPATGSTPPQAATAG